MQATIAFWASVSPLMIGYENSAYRAFVGMGGLPWLASPEASSLLSGLSKSALYTSQMPVTRCVFFLPLL